MEVGKKNFNTNLEVIRGFAALVVIFHHIIFHHKYFNSDFFPTYLKAYELPGHFAVLIFFVLSGYVIGSVHKTQLTKADIWIYLKKRFTRIYPIYFLAIIVGLLVGAHYNAQTICANFTLTQNILYPVIWENNPAWSLNYECLFYLLFIPVSYFNIKPLYAFAFFFLIGTANLYLPTSPIVTGYFYGFCFWLLGLWLAQTFKNGVNDYVNFPAIFFYILALENLIGKNSYFSMSLLISKVKTPLVKTGIWSQFAITVNDLLFIPYCVMLILFVSGKDFKYKTLFFAIIQLLPLFVIYSTLRHSQNLNLDFWVPFGYMIIALVFIFIKLKSDLLNKVGTWFGSISYGLYIVHFPVLYFFGKAIFQVSTLNLYILKVFLFCGITLLLGLFLEKVYQPIIKNWLMKPR